MKRVAVLYATREGQTRRIAEQVAMKLRSRGLDVDVFGQAFIVLRPNERWVAYSWNKTNQLLIPPRVQPCVVAGCAKTAIEQATIRLRRMQPRILLVNLVRGEVFGRKIPAP